VCGDKTGSRHAAYLGGSAGRGGTRPYGCGGVECQFVVVVLRASPLVGGPHKDTGMRAGQSACRFAAAAAASMPRKLSGREVTFDVGRTALSRRMGSFDPMGNTRHQGRTPSSARWSSTSQSPGAPERLNAAGNRPCDLQIPADDDLLQGGRGGRKASLAAMGRRFQDPNQGEGKRG
jgi:hypothetical protein